MKTKNKDCKGCAIYRICNICSSENPRKGECPCIKCLIKMVCKDGCKSYSEFRKEISTWK